MEYTVAQLAKMVEAQPRTIQLWADFGVLVPTKGTQGAGTGTHRRFSITEVRVAALLVTFARIGVPRGVLKRAADKFRDALSPTYPKSRLQTTLRELRNAANRAIEGKGLNFLHYITDGEIFGLGVVTDQDEAGKALLDLRPSGLSSILSESRSAHMGIIDLSIALKGLKE